MRNLTPNEKNLYERSTEIFTKFCNEARRIKPSQAAAAAAAVTASVVMPFLVTDMINEFANSLKLAQEHGIGAYAKMYAQIPGNPLSFVAQALKGELPNAELNQIGRCLFAIAAAPTAASITALAANKYQALKDELALLKSGGRETTIPVGMLRAERPMATKVDTGQDALSREIEKQQMVEDLVARHGGSMVLNRTNSTNNTDSAETEQATKKPFTPRMG